MLGRHAAGNATDSRSSEQNNSSSSIFSQNDNQSSQDSKDSQAGDERTLGGEPTDQENLNKLPFNNQNYECAGHRADGLCWYFANNYIYKSCSSVCSDHGGFDPDMSKVFGQNGGAQTCKTVLATLAGNQAPQEYIEELNPEPGMPGVCHVYEPEDSSGPYIRFVRAPVNPDTLTRAPHLCACKE